MRQKPARSAPSADAGARLLAWYDRHRRVLPWRAAPGARMEPYQVWLSEIMLQQTTVAAVGPYYTKFLARWPDVGALAEAPLDAVLSAWAGLGYYARARNLHACAQAVAARHGGVFPDTEEALRALPGIGAYTAAAVAAIAFDRPAMPIDGNIERVVARLAAIETPLPQAKPLIRARLAELWPDARHGDFAQALMDLGATICTPRKPSCMLCPLQPDCAGAQRGDAETFPRKAPKREGALRRGAAFVVLRADGAVLLRKRAAKGLLGGMSEVPGTDWSADFADDTALDEAAMLGLRAPKWRRLVAPVRHVFTHFPLELTVYVAAAPKTARAPAGMYWTKLTALDDEALPGLMRKVLAAAGVET